MTVVGAGGYSRAAEVASSGVCALGTASSLARDCRIGIHERTIRPADGHQNCSIDHDGNYRARYPIQVGVSHRDIAIAPPPKAGPRNGGRGAGIRSLETK